MCAAIIIRIQTIKPPIPDRISSPDSTKPNSKNVAVITNIKYIIYTKHPELSITIPP